MLTSLRTSPQFRTRWQSEKMWETIGKEPDAALAAKRQAARKASLGSLANQPSLS